MINYDDVTKSSMNRHNLNWQQIPDYAYRLLIIRGYKSWKPDTLLNLIKYQDDDDYRIVDEIHLYVKDPYEAKKQYLVKKRQKMVLKIWKIQRFLLNIQIICRMFI